MYILFTQKVRELGVTRSYTTTNLFSTQLSSKKRLCVYNYIYIQVEIWKWSVVALENCIALYSTSVCVCSMGWLQTLAKPQSHIITSASSSNSKVLDSIASPLFLILCQASLSSPSLSINLHILIYNVSSFRSNAYE